jgi:hypothetical protein
MPRDSHPEQLRSAINRGQTRSKVAFSDPAAAPLGTDEEAAGTPIPPEEVDRAARDEIQRPPTPSSETHAPPVGSFWLMMMAALAVVAAAAFFLAA